MALPWGDMTCFANAPLSEWSLALQNNNENDEREKMRNQLSSSIVTEKPNVHWEDVSGLEHAKDALKEAVILPVKFPQVRILHPVFVNRRTAMWHPHVPSCLVYSFVSADTLCWQFFRTDHRVFILCKVLSSEPLLEVALDRCHDM